MLATLEMSAGFDPVPTDSATAAAAGSPMASASRPRKPVSKAVPAYYEPFHHRACISKCEPSGW